MNLNLFQIVSVIGDEEAAEKFTRINRAYEVLSDQTKRELYDQRGEEEVERYEQ